MSATEKIQTFLYGCSIVLLEAVMIPIITIKILIGKIKNEISASREGETGDED